MCAMSDQFDFSGGKKSNPTDFEKTKGYKPFRVDLKIGRVARVIHRDSRCVDTGDKLVCKCGDDVFLTQWYPGSITREILYAQCNTCYTVYPLDPDFWRVAT